MVMAMLNENLTEGAPSPPTQTQLPTPTHKEAEKLAEASGTTQTGGEKHIFMILMY